MYTDYGLEETVYRAMPVSTKQEELTISFLVSTRNAIPMDAVDVMFLFRLVQSGLIFMAMAAGIVCLWHIFYFRRKSCANSGTSFGIVFAGFVHLIICVRMLSIAEEPVVLPNQAPAHLCLDYTIQALYANSIVYIFILHNLIFNHAQTTVGALFIWILSIGSIYTGLVLIWDTSGAQDVAHLNQRNFLSFTDSPKGRLEAFVSVCEKHLSSEITNVMIEYLILYLPVIIIVTWALARNFMQTREVSMLKLDILSNKECVTNSKTCDCVKLNTVLVAVLVNSAILLFLAKPGYMLYACLTSGYFRDIIPSILQTVLFTHICSQYICKVIVQRRREIQTQQVCKCETENSATV
ncbi:hypothetical protein DPMN_163311 [Dreissena polymorpha]|uniref:Uncharacterized protein n=2 Tax=Dreissena polymorpha TaxID=45954 RepID=A0A9D4IR83_DREPO|nr:hypothetical protein DPMN_163311 [Dreissena polymorpha]